MTKPIVKRLVHAPSRAVVLSGKDLAASANVQRAENQTAIRPRKTLDIIRGVVRTVARSQHLTPLRQSERFCKKRASVIVAARWSIVEIIKAGWSRVGLTRHALYRQDSPGAYSQPRRHPPIKCATWAILNAGRAVDQNATKMSKGSLRGVAP